MFGRRVTILFLLFVGLMVPIGSRSAEAQLAIANKDTDNPTLL